MDSVLAQVIASTRERLQAEGFEVTAGNAINYGWKLTVSSGNECIHIAIYNGKKGISFVVQGKAGDLKKRGFADELIAEITGLSKQVVTAL